eukprot:756348-Hanusia_phi.AAC.6
MSRIVSPLILRHGRIPATPPGPAPRAAHLAPRPVARAQLSRESLRNRVELKSAVGDVHMQRAASSRKRGYGGERGAAWRRDVLEEGVGGRDLEKGVGGREAGKE